MLIHTICHTVTGIFYIDRQLDMLYAKTIGMILSKWFPLVFSVSYVVGTGWNCLYEVIPTCTDSICSTD